MKKLVFIFLTSSTTLAFTGVAQAQYVPGYGGYVPYSSNPGYAGAPTSPQYDYRSRQGNSSGYQWREQRAQEDWRNNTWRERVQQEDWRNNSWREQRATEDWRQREDYAKRQTKNNAIDRGYVECGVGSVGSSTPCDTRDRTEYTVRPNTTATDTSYPECGPNSVVESCRARPQQESNPTPPTAPKRSTTQKYDQKQ